MAAMPEACKVRSALEALTDPEGHIFHGKPGADCTGECKDAREALSKPCAPESHTELAAFLTELASAKPKESAITWQVYEWALELNPNSAKAWNGLGRCHMAAKEWTRARECFIQAASLDSKDPLPCINLALACDHLRDFAQAENWCSQALMADPKCVSAYLELYSIYEQQGLVAFAECALYNGLQIDPDNHDLLFARACLKLKQGDHAQGWKDYEHRPSRISLVAPMDEYPEWHGEPLAGKTIMVVREQGLGDEIMFSRYLPLLHDLGGSVIVYAYSELARLFARAFPWARIVTSDAEAHTVQLDYWVGMSSLLLKLYAGPKHDWRSGIGHEPDGFWDRPQYLYAGPCATNETGKLRVGLCWKGNSKHARDEFRSMAFKQLKPLLEVPGVEFVSLQMNDTESGLHNLRGMCHDWADVADKITGLDLVISVDTGMAHLAGALGKPVWVLLSTLSDWRWGAEGTGTIWYPSMRLYRQETNDWQEVVQQVKADLAIRAASRAPGAVPLIAYIGRLDRFEQFASVGHLIYWRSIRRATPEDGSAQYIHVSSLRDIAGRQFSCFVEDEGADPELLAEVRLHCSGLTSASTHGRPFGQRVATVDGVHGRSQSRERVDPAADQKPETVALEDSWPIHATTITRQCRYGPMTFYPADQWLGRALDLYGEWSEGEVDLFRLLLKPGDMVVEAGANIGAHTVVLAQIVAPTGCVFAFEPQPGVFGVLLENAGRSGVYTFPCALGASCRQIRMQEFDARNPGGCAVIKQPTDPSSPTVRQNTIDCFELKRLDFLKADCEGHELDVLKGAEQTIARCRPLIYVENDREGSTQALGLWLTEHNYRLYQHHIPLYNPNNFRSNPVNVFGGVVSAMILAIPTERKDLRADTLGGKVDRIRWKATA
jgi:FkbM family methyltransferase